MSDINFLKNTHITVKTNASGNQSILIEASTLGRNLAKTLGKHNLEDGYYIIEYTAEVDKGITALIDTLISIRYAHPLLVQLTLDISEWKK
ncbi:MAG: hypothetical protein HN916_04440 [Anaerolineae bacterium]|jgi:hypothetical protein|nr:hypothetical protein [Anaerolineae bacterium]MBT7991065.1 hypothetical protein [Anaerolineae bacterium]